MNVALRNLRAVFNDAVRKGLFSETPMRATKMLTVPKKTFPPYITMRQFKTVVLAIVTDQRHHVAFSLAMLAGLRRREIAHLRWDQIDFDAGIISIESRDDFQTKSGRGRVLPLYSSLREELMKLRAQQQAEDDRRSMRKARNTKPELKREYVLQARLRIPDGISLNEAWTTYIDRFTEADPSFPRITLHGLRHSFATWLASEAGLNLRALQALLGHAHIETTMVYAHIQPQLAVEAAKAYDV